MSNIDQGFDELFKRLEEKKNQLKKEFENRFKQEEQKLREKSNNNDLMTS